jgi:hypothetical protein
MTEPIKPDAEDFKSVAADPMNQSESAAEAYRLAQAAKILRLFRKAHGRDAKSVEELDAWVANGRF